MPEITKRFGGLKDKIHAEFVAKLGSEAKITETIQKLIKAFPPLEGHMTVTNDEVKFADVYLEHMSIHFTDAAGFALLDEAQDRYFVEELAAVLAPGKRCIINW